MKFFFQLDEDIIRDAVTYPYDGYVEVDLDTTYLPAGINAGCYRLEDGLPILDQTLKDEMDKPSHPADYVELDTRQGSLKKKAKSWLERLNLLNRN